VGFLKVDSFIRGAGCRPAPSFPIMWMRGKDQRGKGYGPNCDPSEGRSKRVCLAGRSIIESKPILIRSDFPNILGFSIRQ
jgi:hypothetical protein